MKTPLFIMVTAASNDQMTLDSFRLGASYFIIKPFEKDILMDKIRRVCSGKTGRPGQMEKSKLNPYIDRAEYDGLIHSCFLGTILGNMLYIKGRK